MSDGSYDSPTQKYLDSHSSSPSKSPKSIGNSQSNSPIANDDGNIINNNFQNSAFSPGLNNVYRSQNSSKTQNLTPTQNTTTSFKYSKNNIHINKLSEIEEEELVSDDSTANNGFSSNKTVSPNNRLNIQNESESDAFDVKLNESETNLTKEFSRNISNLFTPQTQKIDIPLLSDSDSESSSFHPKQSFSGSNAQSSNFSYQKASSQNIAYLSESETNESDLSSSGLNRKVTSYINHIKYLNSSELETSSTSSANVLSKNYLQKRNVNDNLDSDTGTISEESTRSKFKRTARRQINSHKPKQNSINSNINIDLDSETTEESVTNLTKNSFNKGISGLHLDSDSELNSEDSSANKHYENLSRSAKSTYSISKINLNSDSETNSESSLNFNYKTKSTTQSNHVTKNLNSDSETNSESSLNFNYKTKSPTQNNHFTSNLNSDSSEEFSGKNISSNKKKSNDLDLNLSSNKKKSNDLIYIKSPSLNQKTTTPGVRNFNQNLDSSSEAFIETPKFPISKRNESALISDSSEEFNPIRNNYNSSTTPKSFARYSSPKNSSFQNINKDVTNYSFKKSKSNTPNTSSLVSNKKTYQPSSNSRSSFISNNSRILENDFDTDSDDEFLATLKQTIKDNEALLRSFGHTT